MNNYNKVEQLKRELLNNIEGCMKHNIQIILKEEIESIIPYNLIKLKGLSNSELYNIVCNFEKSISNELFIKLLRNIHIRLHKIEY
jgi:hypothetical protein